MWNLPPQSTRSESVDHVGPGGEKGGPLEVPQLTVVPDTTLDVAPSTVVPDALVQKHGSTFARVHVPIEKQLHVAGPRVAAGSGSTSPTHGPQVGISSPVHVVVPSMQLPRPRSARGPVQQGAVMPGVGQLHP